MGARIPVSGGIGENRLSDAACKAKVHQDADGAPRRPPYKLSDGAGLYLLVQPHGSRLWRMKYRHEGKERVYAIGAYPEISLSKAREARDRARDWLREGRDPTLERRADRAHGAAKQASTFRLMAEEWMTAAAAGANRERRPWSPAHRDAQRKRLDSEILPAIGDVQLDQVKPAAVLEMLRKIETRGAHETAAKCRVMVSQIFRYAVQTDRAETDPAALLAGALQRPKTEHRATISAGEMPAMFKALRALPSEPVTKLALYWLIVTAARTVEMRFAEWREIEDRKMWRVPAERMKMRLEHVVPLSTHAQKILEAAKPLRTSKDDAALIFPGFARHGALSENALLALLARAGYYGRQTAHGFRASFSTWAHEVAEADPDVIEACLAHVRGDVRAVYNRAQYLSKRRELLQQWADQCSAWGMKLP